MTAPQTAEQTLVAWLGARLDEDEAAAREVIGQMDRGAVWAIPPFFEDDHTLLAHGTVLATPTRVLADVESKRRIVVLHAPEREIRFDLMFPPTCPACVDWSEHDGDGVPASLVYPCPTLRALAAPYSSSEGFRGEWSV